MLIGLSVLGFLLSLLFFLNSKKLIIKAKFLDQKISHFMKSMIVCFSIFCILFYSIGLDWICIFIVLYALQSTCNHRGCSKDPSSSLR